MSIFRISKVCFWNVLLLSGNKKKFILIPETAHGTNPASVVLSGYEVLQVKTDKDGYPIEFKILHFHPLDLGSHAATEWEALQSATNGVVKGVNIVFKEVDCDSDTTTADEFNITGYPTIKLVYDDKTYEYDAKPQKEVLLKFLHEVL